MFAWKILELFADGDQLTGVRYLLSKSENDSTVESEGNHHFSDGLVNKSLPEIVEADIVYWLEKDTTVDGVNAIKLAIDDQLKSLKTNQKVDFPWLAGTFTIE